jgi:thiamine monophosphate synthase
MVELGRKDAGPAELRSRAESCPESAHRAGALFLVDEHVQRAVEVNADGVHLGQEGVGVAKARSLLLEFRGMNSVAYLALQRW